MLERMRLALEYYCSPIWIIDDDGSSDTIAVEDMDISDSLKKDIITWDNLYQATFDAEYPPDSGFSSKEADDLLKKSFRLEGKALFLRLKEELKGKYIFEYMA
ncbi:hypothetical protein [Pseudodesulfovibrio piezophilus]|uniref:Uncharacterized protein n=1 Tax=Pseudodesulfovibrio piezophilus (strain DSM 21447 / JCM 15486 / C1TLV30) TaxID=1322246 RepID=M1WS83_PSEP2|nr:hypothetical protein [Pseudodesulfovibrio piezophilus]CCH48757.1 conserved protein of unknown function [Pseudodesulfovibrio piezophilus C1TLV30]